MTEDKRLLILGKKSGGGGDAVWGSITGTLSNQTDLMTELNNKADTSSVPTKTSDLTNDSGFRKVIEINDMTQEELLDFYTNYETRLKENTYVVGGYSFSTLTVTNPQVGTVLVLESNKQFKDQEAGATAGTINVSVTITYIFANGTKSSSSGTYTVPRTSSLATVATSGLYSDLTGTPEIPTVNDSTITFEDSEGTTIDSFTLNQDSNKTITIPSGGGSSKQWFGTEEMFNSIPQNELDPDCDYFISDAIDYRDIVNTPTIPEKVSQLDNDSNFSSENFVRGEIYKCLELIKNRDKYITRAEYEALELAGKLEEDVNYHIEGDVDTVEMVVTFTDQSTATYEVYIKPNI